MKTLLTIVAVVIAPLFAFAADEATSSASDSSTSEAAQEEAKK
jgi:hypothetical protein